MNWSWQGHRITYVQAGEQGPAIVLVHGFGANVGHWRKNIPALSQGHRVFALDLLGFGGSAKPVGADYTFETWGQQVADFVAEVVQAPAVVVGNSIGAIVALQTAVMSPQVQGVTLINCSLRLLHRSKRGQIPWLRRVGTPLVQGLLSKGPVSRFFFDRLRQPATVRKILTQAYGDPTAVTPELVELLIAPSRDPGALGVFLAFINYDTGPLAEDLLPIVTCPVQVLWGELDPWEPIALGRTFTRFPQVQRFVALPGAGHCPQDEVPARVNPLLAEWADLCFQNPKKLSPEGSGA
ncbi:alpha/beta fold hydrolase [Candidatus Cyanaurora vandensis]|uniref:alpha/beta fold hydrolase n=1 Tax=Candidatus Cyanaurora vandensis TaxID=2714958 RepID=UPI00257CF2F4|nr:alpha/beta fold hydrolase [Candidatus Cyanaurora vandensis]